MKKLEYWAKYFGIPIPEITRENYFVVQDTVMAAMATFSNRRAVEIAVGEIKREAIGLQKNVLAG